MSTRLHIVRRTGLLALALSLSVAGMAQEMLPAVGASRSAADLVAEARARFDPDFPGVRSEHAHGNEPCLTSLFSGLRDVAHQLDPQERQALSALDPHLKNALKAGGAPQEGLSGLPDEPELTERYEGKSCVVHYAKTGVHAVPNKLYARMTAINADQAIRTLEKHFKAPFFAEDTDGEDVLHIYIKDTSLGPEFDTAVYGFVGDVDDVPGDGNEKARTIYMVIHNDVGELSAPIGVNWVRQLRSTVFHEYAHCIQYAYNAYLSPWFIEGQATWFEGRWARVFSGIKGHLAGDDSLTNVPELPLYANPDDSTREYSTAPLFAYLEHRLGRDANALLLEHAPDTNDGMLVLENTLIIEEFITLEDFLTAFYTRLLNRTIRGLPRAYLPKMKLTQAGVTDFGWSVSSSVGKTGARAYELRATPGLRTDLIFARISNQGGGSPTGVLVHRRDHRLVLDPGWNTLDRFRGAAKLVFLVTDADYAFPTEDISNYLAEVFPPVIRIKQTERETPIFNGETSTITFTYDLLNVPQGDTFGIILYRMVRGPKGYKDEQQIGLTWDVGSDQQAEVTFVTPPFVGPGNYIIDYTARTPNDAYGGEHMKSKTRTSVLVKKAP